MVVSSYTSDSGQWPTFAEMMASAVTSSTSSTKPWTQKLPEASPLKDNMVSQPGPDVGSSAGSGQEAGLMDYAWNEDNINIDFMTGEK